MNLKFIGSKRVPLSLRETAPYAQFVTVPVKFVPWSGAERNRHQDEKN